MVGAIAAATQREPVVVGKPSTFMLDHICNSFGISKAEICMVVRSPPANCIIIDHFSAFEPGLVALFRELLLKNGWQYVKTARNLNLGVSRNSFCDFLLTLIAEVSAVLGRLLCKSQYTYFSTHLLCKLLATLSLARSVPRLRRRFTKANPCRTASGEKALQQTIGILRRTGRPVGYGHCVWAGRRRLDAARAVWCDDGGGAAERGEQHPSRLLYGRIARPAGTYVVG
jgi:hypothetical protein